MVDCFEDLDIELLGLRRVEWHAESYENIGETLYTGANGVVPEVQMTSLRNRAVVDIAAADEGEGREITDCRFRIN
jgi:hypothetical protein